MSYSSKSIKINFFCRKLYEHTIEILEKDKSVLSNLYIAEKFGTENEIKLARYNYNELFVEMIDGIENLTSYAVLELKQEISTKERILELKKIMNLDNNKNMRANLSFRVPAKNIEKVKKIKEHSGVKTISEVAEIAIMNYVNQLDEIAYKLLKITIDKEFS
ncbi:hypothetical protein MKX73_19090 [Solibacillus sp. FSL W7-1436]|uniref:hypothetical protein n=1 Tax=Solibacillus sp. FSL W7-1436 TaxID=2921705 RepID=UPI0030F8953C